MKHGKYEAPRAAKSAQDAAPEQPMEKPEAEQNTTPEKNAVLYLHDIVYLLAAVILVFVLVFRVAVVSGPSMRNTLIDGDYLLMLSSTFYQTPKQGDIIVASKASFEDGELIVKRIIATEGQKVDIDFNAGIVYVDDQPLSEPYTLTPTNLAEGTQFPLIVGEGCVFAMGDNRNISKDSRSTEIGLIDTREILGKAVLLFFPGNNKGLEQRQFSRIGVLS